MLSLAFAGLAFILVHVGLAGTRVRDRVVGAIGERGYLLAFSLGTIALIVWLVTAYRAADYVPLWAAPEWWKLVADVLMLPAFLLVVVGLLTPTPTSVGQAGLAGQAPRGIIRITRHPFLVGVALWATLHLVANGDVASALLFGTVLIVAVTGPASIDAKRRRALGPAAWDGFARQTSILPFAAGRAPSAGEIGWWRIGLGVLAYALFIGGHRHIIGVSPFPHW